MNVISEQSKLQHEYGEFYVYLDFVNKLEKQGICLFDDKKERAEFLGMCLLGECLRTIAINNPQLFLNDDTPKDYNTDNIYIGQVIPNYKKLCELLEVEPKTGKSRQLQEKDFFRYFDYEKLKFSNEYLILDIYDKPIKKNEQADFNEEVLIESAKREAAKSIGFKNSNTASLFNPKAYNKELDKIYHRYGWLGVFNQIKIGADSKMLSTPINEYTNYYMIDYAILFQTAFI